MSFKSSNVTVRMGIRDAAYRLGKLSELMTIGHGPVDSHLSDQIDDLAKQMEKALADAGYLGEEPANATRVTNGDILTVNSGSAKTAPAKAAIANSKLTTLALTEATDALTSNGESISIQDRNGVTLLGSAVTARVVDNRLISAALSALTNAINSDGNPLDITTTRGGSTVTGRVRVLVTANQVKNVYLDNTAALQTGASVPVQNASGLNIEAGAVTVANNVVSAVKLPGTITAFSNGRTHDVSDIDGRKVAVPVVVNAGNYVSQILPVGSAIVRSTDKFRLQDGQGSAGANGVSAHFTAAGSVDYFTVGEYLALVRNGQAAIFAMKWDNTANQVGDVNMTAYVGQAGTFRPLFPKTAMAIKDGATVVGTDGKSYTFAVANGVLTSVTTA